MVTNESLDVVVVPFPFTERPVTKRRPAVVVSASRFNTAHAGKILAMVTSTPARWPSDVALRDWRQAGLNVACWVRFKLHTLFFNNLEGGHTHLPVDHTHFQKPK